MDRVSESNWASRHRGLVVVAVAVALLLLIWAGWSVWPREEPVDRTGGEVATVREPAGGSSVPGWPLITVLALIAGAVWLIRGRLRHQLHEARTNAQALSDLMDAWQWQTDADHCLVAWRPPTGTPAAAWQPPPQPTPLWMQFELDATPSGVMRAQLDAHAALSPLRLRRLEDGRSWMLRGVPRFDTHGAFVGYLGTAREMTEHDQRVGDQHALDALLPMLPVPIIVA
ncbi:MAG: sensory box histidine kinase, partial [Rhizobacter sp.]|nr:sensory box histidine kinase [Rhizobacter sp.]